MKTSNITFNEVAGKSLNVKISAVLCTYNEDFYLDECLKSLSWADEIVLCDMGSQDKTLEIASKHNCHIHSIPKVEFIELARRKVVSYCSNEWICYADPDFIFPDEAVSFIKNVISSDPEVACFNILYVNHYKGKPIWYGRWGARGMYPAVFKKDAMELPDVLHNGFVLKYGKSFSLKKSICIKHMWVRDEKHFYEKHLRYIEHEGKRRLLLGRKPSRIEKFRLILSRCYFYIFKGGFLDGNIGYELFKKSIWYELESEKRLAEIFQTTVQCGICNVPNNKIEHSLYDDRYGYSGQFLLFLCPSCGHRTLKNEFSAKLLSELYSRYYPRSSFKLEDYKPAKEVSGFKAWFDGAYSSSFRWVPKNVCVLDIGCGFGESLAYYKSRGCEVYGVEADENIRRVAERFGYNVYVGLFNPELYTSDFFDYVTMAQVIEHVTDPVSFLKGVAKVLKPGGCAVLSTPNSNGWGAWVFGRKWINWHAPYHLHHFSLKSMKIAVEEAGLKLEGHKIITSSEWLYYQWLHLASYPRMGQPSPFWAQTGNLSLKQRLVFGLITLIHKAKINHIITRLFDGIGIGDNFIFILRKP